MVEFRDRQGYGIKREQQIPRAKKEICKDCKKGLIFRYYDIKLDSIVTRCQNCTITRLDPKKEIYPSFKDGTGKNITNC